MSIAEGQAGDAEPNQNRQHKDCLGEAFGFYNVERADLVADKGG